MGHCVSDGFIHIAEVSICTKSRDREKYMLFYYVEQKQAVFFLSNIGKTSFNKEHKEIVLYACKFDYSNTQMSTQMELYFFVEVSSQQQRKHILLCQKTSFAWVGFPLIIIFSHPNQASRVLSERLNHQITNCFIQNFLHYISTQMNPQYN